MKFGNIVIAHGTTRILWFDLQKKKNTSYLPALRTHGGFFPPPNGDRLLILQMCSPICQISCVCKRNDRSDEHSRSSVLHSDAMFFGHTT